MITIIGGLALLNSLFATLIGENDSARGFLLSGVLGCFLGTSFLILLWDAPKKTGAREGLLFVVSFWFLIPVIAAPPFWASSVVDSWIQASFEAISNLTTTGSTIGQDTQPVSIRFWRAILQFIGGVSGVVMAVVVLAALNLAGPGVHRSHLLTLPKDDLFGKIGRVSLTISIVYGVLAIVGALAMAASGVDLMDAITRSVAAISTSNVLSNVPGAYAYSPFSVFILTILLFVGATNIALHTDILRQNSWKVYLKDSETQILLFGVIVFTGLLCAFSGRLDVRFIPEALSFIATSGMDITGTEKVLNVLPQPIPDLFVFVGAAALSTAGGLKMTRVLVLLSRAFAEFKRLSFDHSTAELKFQGRTRADNIVVGVWVYLIAYLGACILIGILLSITGLDLELAFRSAIGSISNTGPLLDVAIVDQELSTFSILVISLGCILGRIEVPRLSTIVF